MSERIDRARLESLTGTSERHLASTWAAFLAAIRLDREPHAVAFSHGVEQMRAVDTDLRKLEPAEIVRLMLSTRRKATVVADDIIHAPDTFEFACNARFWALKWVDGLVSVEIRHDCNGIRVTIEGLLEDIARLGTAAERHGVRWSIRPLVNSRQDGMLHHARDFPGSFDTAQEAVAALEHVTFVPQ